MNHVLITGGGRGIGRACALAFASAGWRTSFSYVQNREAAEQTARQIWEEIGRASCRERVSA